MKKLVSLFLLLLFLIPAAAGAETEAWGFANQLYDIGEDAVYIRVNFYGVDGLSHKGYMDSEGNVLVCFGDDCTLSDDNGGYAIVRKGADQSWLIDVKNRKVVADSANGGFVQAVSVGSWNGHGYFLTYGKTEDFFAGTSYPYRIQDETGRVVYEKAEPTTVRASYCGEGWFLFNHGGTLDYVNAETGRTASFEHLLYRPSRVENGYTTGCYVDDSSAFHYYNAVIVNLENGTYEKFDTFGYGDDEPEIGPLTEGKAVVIEYNSFRPKEPVKALYYIAPGNKCVRLSSIEPYLCSHPSLRFQDGKLLLPVKGADGREYVTIMDEKDRMLVQPILAQYLPVNWISGHRFLIHNDRVAYVYDDNGQLLFSGSDYPGSNDYIGTFRNGLAVLGTSKLIDVNGNVVFEGEVRLTDAVKLLPE